MIKRRRAIPGMRRHHLGGRARLSSQLREVLSEEPVCPQKHGSLYVRNAATETYLEVTGMRERSPVTAGLRLRDEHQHWGREDPGSGTRVRGPAQLSRCVPLQLLPLPGPGVSFYNGNHHYAQ